MQAGLKVLVGATFGLLLSGIATAGVAIDAARVGVDDVVSAAKLYESAFGLQEVNRFGAPNGGAVIEILMNFGDTAAAAKANKNAQVVVMHRDGNAVKDPLAHLIFSVTDMAATGAAVKAAGGTMDGEPKEFGKTGILIGFAVDPAGNRIELIQQAKH